MSHTNKQESFERIDALATKIFMGMDFNPGDEDIDHYNIQIAAALEEEGLTINEYHDFLLTKFENIVENETIN